MTSAVRRRSGRQEKTPSRFRNIFFNGRLAQLVRAPALLGKLQREGSLWKIQKN